MGPQCIFVSSYLGDLSRQDSLNVSSYLRIFVSLGLESAGFPQCIFVSSYLWDLNRQFSENHCCLKRRFSENLDSTVSTGQLEQKLSFFAPVSLWKRCYF